MLTKNDILRRIRYIFDYSDAKMIEIFAQADVEVNRSEVSNWLKKEEDPDFVEMTDRQLAVFLNGLINDKRGRREGPQPRPEKILNNNIILRKLKIAFAYRDTDMLEILELAGRKVSKHELSALFRNPAQHQFRICKAQFLRNFLQGMQIKYRPN